MDFSYRLRSRRARIGRCARALGAVLFGTLGVACTGGDLRGEGSASNVDAASEGLLPAEASAVDSGLLSVGVDASGLVDGANGDGAMLDGGTLGDGGNLILNPSCEEGVLDWTTLGGTSLLESSTAFVCPGNTASCRAFDRMDESSPPALSSYDGPLQDITSVVVPGHSYTVSAWALWAPPPSEAGAPGNAGDDGSTGSPDGAVGSDASVDAGPGFEPQSVYITARVFCTQNSVSNVTYPRLALAFDVPEATWTPVQDSTPLTIPTGCSGLDVQLFVEGPDIGLDLYTDEVTLLLLQ